MKRFFHLSFCILLIAGCKVHTFTVTDKKIPTRPYSKILAVYLDEACDFTLFDSTTYNICLKSCFAKTDNLPLRGEVESLLVEKIATGGTTVNGSAELLDSVTNSYSDFRKAVEEGGFDAILLVAFRRTNRDIYSNGEASPQGRGPVHENLVPGFQCYLFNARNSSFPIWTVRIDIGDNRYNARDGLTGRMASEIAKSLKTIGYIAH